MNDFLRARAFEIHQTLKARGLHQVKRNYPAEAFGAFVTYFTPKELHESPYGEALLSLLPDLAPPPYVILDRELGVARLAGLLDIEPKAAWDLAELFTDAFNDLAPGRVFLCEEDFVNAVVMPRLTSAIHGSHDFKVAFAALEAPQVGLGMWDWRDSADFYTSVPGVSYGMQPRQNAGPVQRLRQTRGEVWDFHVDIDIYPADEAGNGVANSISGIISVHLPLRKVDRAFIDAGEYMATIRGTLSKFKAGYAWTVDDPRVQIPVVI